MTDEPCQATFLQDLFVAGRKLRNLFDARSRQSGMTYVRAKLLLYLVHNPGPTQAEVADALDVERPTIARLIDGMEAAGLVCRRAMDSDRRLRRIFLTPAAEEQVQQVRALSEALRDDAMAGIDPDELAVARRVIAKVLANISAAG